MEHDTFLHIVPINKFFFQFCAFDCTFTYVIIHSGALNWNKISNRNDMEVNVMFQFGALPVILKENFCLFIMVVFLELFLDIFQFYCIKIYTGQIF